MNTTSSNHNDQQPVPISAGLLEQIVTASSLMEAARERAVYSGGEEEESEGEVFEDGDEDTMEVGEEEQSGVAAVLTELSQATVTGSVSNSNNIQQPPRPNMTATINSINALLQSHIHGPSPPHKVRLSGPIRANVNIRHGVWAPRLRCRKRKNLHAKDGIWIHANCTIEQLIGLVRGVLPDEFEWDPQGSPLRYQAVNDQSLQSLKTVSGTVASGQSLFAAFDLVRNRRSDGDNFILQLYVYGTWTVLLKPHLLPSSVHHQQQQVEDDSVGSSALPPPPKKKYQQAHYTQQQQQQQMNEIVSASESPVSSVTSNPNVFIRHPILTQTAAATTPFYAHHPLAANPPVTFLPTVTLEMKLNGTFVPVEVTRRSFIAAFRACSIPKQKEEIVTSTSNTSNNNTTNTGTNTTSNNNNTTININTPHTNPSATAANSISYITNNITPPPSDA